MAEPLSFLGADHVRGTFRSWDQLVLTLVAVVITAFAIAGRAQNRLEEEMKAATGDYRSTIQFLVYVVVCAPFAMFFQAVNAGNQPGSPWEWCIVSGSLCVGEFYFFYFFLLYFFLVFGFSEFFL